MSTLSLRLPESLHKRLAELAAREGISINQLIASAVAEKRAALDTEELLGARAARDSRRGFLAALATVPDAPRMRVMSCPLRRGCGNLLRSAHRRKLPNSALEQAPADGRCSARGR